jgi:hypothetical protein
MNPRSSWYYALWPALVMATIQLFITLDGRSFGDVVFGVVLIFFVYWIVLTFWIWLFRAVKERYFSK